VVSWSSRNGWCGGRDASVHASPGDLLSHFRFGLMGAVEPRYKRLVLPVDIVWVRLGDEKALPGPNLRATTANVKVKEFILTPKIGFRIVNQQSLRSMPLQDSGTGILGRTCSSALPYSA
jgi:hypothetical protein